MEIMDHLQLILLLCFTQPLRAQNAAGPCSAPPALPGGYFVPHQQTYAHQSLLAYSCDPGLKPALEGWWATSTCDNGMWSHTPQCIDEKACYPPNIPNAQYIPSPSGWYENEEVIRVKCDAAYEHRDYDATGKCENGTWSSLPICDRSQAACERPPLVLNGVLTGVGHQQVFPPDTKLQLHCADGYSVQGANIPASIICLDGNWTESPVCKRNKVADPGPAVVGGHGGGHGGGQGGGHSGGLGVGQGGGHGVGQGRGHNVGQGRGHGGGHGGGHSGGLVVGQGGGHDVGQGRGQGGGHGGGHSVGQGGGYGGGLGVGQGGGHGVGVGGGQGGGHDGGLGVGQGGGHGVGHSGGLGVGQGGGHSVGQGRGHGGGHGGGHSGGLGVGQGGGHGVGQGRGQGGGHGGGHSGGYGGGLGVGQGGGHGVGVGGGQGGGHGGGRIPSTGGGTYPTGDGHRGTGPVSGGSAAVSGPYEGGSKTVRVSNCGNHPTIQNGDVVKAAEMFLKYKCNRFYTLVGLEEVVCYSDGSWSPTPTCKATYCTVDNQQYPELIDNGVRFVAHGKTRKFECVKQRSWMTDHYSKGTCYNGRLTMSECCSWVSEKLNQC